MSPENDEYAKLRAAIQDLQKPKVPAEQEAEAAKKTFAARVNELIEKSGFGREEAIAIATLELDPNVRKLITLDVASQMFGGGLSESLSNTFSVPKG